MNITIEPGCAVGYMMAPSSKSMAHRLLICAGLCQGVSHIRCMDFNADILATIACLRALGVVCDVDGDTVTVQGVDMKSAKPEDILDCHESGSTLRFFIPLALLGGETVRFTGTEKLLSRPLGVYAQLCAQHGFTYEKNPHFLEIQGKLTPDTFTVPGDISSQFITGLLMALPLLEGDSVITITPPVYAPYGTLEKAVFLFPVILWVKSPSITRAMATALHSRTGCPRFCSRVYVNPLWIRMH